MATAYKILVVDDEPDVELLIKQRFRRQILVTTDSILNSLSMVRKPWHGCAKTTTLTS